MNAALPDVSVTDSAPGLSPLEWVGMEGIDLPITIADAGYQREIHARADVQVDLPVAHVKGIHMSRLYRRLDELSEAQQLTPSALHKMLTDMVASHSECGSRNARVRLSFDLLIRRPALRTENLSGWKSYPVVLEAGLINGSFTLNARVSVGYSSTCPCSSALTRQLVEQGFQQAFNDREQIDVSEAADWLRANATLATPHSQRSEALVQVGLSASADNLQLLDLIERTETAVGTPLQTAVKRADEQAFAGLNGGNLMFVEDAVRRIQLTLVEHYRNPAVHVRHLESLHPHDAVAWAGDRHNGLYL